MFGLVHIFLLDNVVKNNYISTNTNRIELNDVENGTQKLFTGIVRSGNYLSSYTKTSAIGNDTTKYSKLNTITLTGTHVADDGVTTTPINKTVEFYVDWYGTVSSRITTTNVTNRITDWDSLYDEENLNLSNSEDNKED